MYHSALSRTERDEAAYISACGQNGAETVVDVWIDMLPQELRGVMTFRRELIELLKRHWTELAQAEAASVLTGGGTLEDWLSEQEEIA